MNFPRFFLAAALLGLALDARPARADTTENYSFNVGTVIPDNASSGLADSRVLSSGILDITAVQVTLNISGGFNGDYYAYLIHSTASGTGFSILLNRVGRTATDSFGYTDAGLTSVTFAGSALNDIHSYRSVSNPGGAALSGGLWAVDGRNVDPASVLDTDPRTALLSSFNGLDANGAWTLFIADVAPFGTGTLVSWNLQVTGVPEPGTWAAGALLLGALGLHLRRRLAGMQAFVCTRVNGRFRPRAG